MRHFKVGEKYLILCRCGGQCDQTSTLKEFVLEKEDNRCTCEKPYKSGGCECKMYGAEESVFKLFGGMFASQKP